MKSTLANLLLVLAFCTITVPVSTSAATKKSADLEAAIADRTRNADNAARDIYRHPYETLTFWGLKPNMTVIEIAPGGAYWTEILAPYAKATGGHYIGQMPDETNPKIPEAARKNITMFKARYADEAKFGKVAWVDWQPGTGRPLGRPNSADMVICARYMHDYMWTKGAVESVLKDVYAVLKPGGILAIEQHRADPRKQVQDAHDGYINTDFMIAALTEAGFRLDAKSEVNANPKDTKDYPLGVWTLPPTSARTKPPYMLEWFGRPSESLLKDPAFYKAIGESDRMTLRFRTPV